MAKIETREESNAVQVASDALDRHLDAYDRELFRAGWLAGRDWARNQEMLAQIEAQRQRAVAEGQAAVKAGLRLLGCPHTVSCTSVAQCDRMPSAR